MEKYNMVNPAARFNCKIPGCGNKYYHLSSIKNTKIKNKRFFQFPKNKEKRQIWIDSINKRFKEKIEYPLNSFVCEDHFRETDFSDTNRKRLLSFSFPFSEPPQIDPGSPRPSKIQKNGSEKLDEPKLEYISLTESEEESENTSFGKFDQKNYVTLAETTGMSSKNLNETSAIKLEILEADDMVNISLTFNQ